MIKSTNNWIRQNVFFFLFLRTVVDSFQQLFHARLLVSCFTETQQPSLESFIFRLVFFADNRLVYFGKTNNIVFSRVRRRQTD